MSVLDKFYFMQIAKARIPQSSKYLLPTIEDDQGHEDHFVNKVGKGSLHTHTLLS